MKDNFATGVSTAFVCSNVSGQAASVRFLVLGNAGNVAASVTLPFAYGETKAAVTNDTAPYVGTILNTGSIGAGVINIESAQSGVFCTAVARKIHFYSFDLHLVRINGHPGAEE